MDKLKEDSDLGIVFLKGISVINLIIAASFMFANVRFKYIIINIILVFLLESILRPLNIDFSKKKLEQSGRIRIYILKLILLIIFSISTYIIFWTKNYSLKYTYVFAFLSALILLLYSCYYEIKRKYENREAKGKKRNKLYVLLVFILPVIVVMFFSFSVIKDTFRPEKSLTIKNIKTPESISISEERIINPRNIDEIVKHISEIEDIESQELIGEIIEELESEKIKNLQGAEIFNYEKMKSDYSDQYLLNFNYDGVYGNDLKIEEGYIESIRITSEKEAYLEDTIETESILLGYKILEDNYPLELPEELLEEIISYIE